MRAIPLLLFIGACGAERPELAQLDECVGAKCDQLAEDLVCGVGDGAGGDVCQAPQQPRSTSQRLRLKVVVGKRVIAEIASRLEQRAREEIRQQGGDLAYVDLGCGSKRGPNPELERQLAGLAAALKLGLTATDVEVDLRVSYSRWQVKQEVVAIVGRLLRTFPFRGRVRWRIGCNVSNQRGLAYNWYVSPMINCSISTVHHTVSATIQGFLAEHGLSERVAVTLQQTCSCPATTSITVSSGDGAFQPVTVSWDQAQAKLDEIFGGL